MTAGAAPVLSDSACAGAGPEQAVRYAMWWLNVALDRVGDGRRYHPGLRGRLDTARAALAPAVNIAQPIGEVHGSVHRD